MGIDNHLKVIKEGVFGREVRQAIHDGIQQAYDDATANGNANMEVAKARGNAGALAERLDQMELADKSTAQDISVVSGQINNLIANAGDGTVPSELTDMRVAFDGQTYDTAGKAVREQFTDLKNDTTDLKRGETIAYRPSLRFGGLGGNVGNAIVTNTSKTRASFILAVNNEFDNAYMNLTETQYSATGLVVDNANVIVSFVRASGVYSKYALLEKGKTYLFTFKKDDNTDFLDTELAELTELAVVRYFDENQLYPLTIKSLVLGSYNIVSGKVGTIYSTGLSIPRFYTKNAIAIKLKSSNYNIRDIVTDSEGSIESNTNYFVGDNLWHLIPSGYHHINFTANNNSVLDAQSVFPNVEIVTKIADVVTVAQSAGAIDTVISRNPYEIDAIYAASDWNRLNKDAYKKVWGNKKFTLGIMSDTHGDTNAMSNFADLVNNVDAIDGALNVGDVERQNPSAGNMTMYVPLFNKITKPFMHVLGNHDVRCMPNPSASGNYSVEQATADYIGRTSMSSKYTARGYGYHDFVVFKVRLIVLNEYDYPDDVDSSGNWVYYNSMQYFGKSQLDWFVNVLNNTPADYAVIISRHSSEPTIYDENIVKQHYTAKDVAARYDGSIGYMSDTVIADIVDAWINKSTLTKQYTYTAGGTVDVVADFGNRTNSIFVTYIVGHRHRLGVGSLQKYPNQRVIAVDTSSSDSSYPVTENSLIPRNRNGKSQDCFSVLSYDSANKIINLVTVGANKTKFLEDVAYISFQI
ncbi:TPA: metallophosphoesterase [Streptococcus suis]|nr:metallophosphoesterase [Streptococcus suis]